MMAAADAAVVACRQARCSAGDRSIRFFSADAHSLPLPDNSFDIALVQSVLHHDYDPADIIREAFRLAPCVVIHEPNGFNPGLKAIEKLSSYHRQHDEKSYAPSKLIRWVIQAGGSVVSSKYSCFVPMFSPDWLARTMKRLEPYVEGFPILKHCGCSQFTIVAKRAK